jgi:hypothetical protein
MAVHLAGGPSPESTPAQPLQQDFDSLKLSLTVPASGLHDRALGVLPRFVVSRAAPVNPSTSNPRGATGSTLPACETASASRRRRMAS